MTLLERMSTSIETMTLGEKFLGSLQVTLLGVAVVFLALALLYLIIMVLDRFIHQAESSAAKRKAATDAAAYTAPEGGKLPAVLPAQAEKEEDMGQLVAVITAAVAASLHTSTHNIVVRNIVRTPDTAPAWNRLGRTLQTNQRVR